MNKVNVYIDNNDFDQTDKKIFENNLIKKC